MDPLRKSFLFRFLRLGNGSSALISLRSSDAGLPRQRICGHLNARARKRRCERVHRICPLRFSTQQKAGKFALPGLF